MMSISEMPTKQKGLQTLVVAKVEEAKDQATVILGFGNRPQQDSSNLSGGVVEKVVDLGGSKNPTMPL